MLGRFLVTPGEAARIADRVASFARRPELEDLAQDELAERAKDAIARGIAELSEAQELLWATDRYAVLVVLQAMDAAGKDSVIKHVMSGVNPQGVQVVSFKQPSSEELDHDFLWRISKALPQRGRIGIFNRSHYEEVVALKVHPEWLEPQRLPPGDRGEAFWQERYEDINAFERHLDRNGTKVVKFFLNVSKEAQKKRFLARLDVPGKEWKFNAADVAERARFDDYISAFEDALTATSHPVGAVVRHPRRPLVADAGVGRVGARGDARGSLGLAGPPSLPRTMRPTWRRARRSRPSPALR